MVAVDGVEKCMGECWSMVVSLFGTVSVVSDRRLECDCNV